MLNPFGLQNPYTNTTPDQVQQDPGPQSGAVNPALSAEQAFSAPLPIAYAATEEDVQRAQEAEANGGTVEMAPPASFLSPTTPAVQGNPANPADPNIWE